MAVIKSIVATEILSYFKEYGCKNCGDTDVDLILEKRIYNPKDRGNENDKYEWWCRRCSSGDKTWIEYEKELVEQKIKEEKELEEMKADIITKVSKVTTDEELEETMSQLVDKYNIPIY